MKTHVERYIENHFAVDLFTIEDEPGFFQGKKVTDGHGKSAIIEGIPFMNSVIVHLDDETTKYIFDEENSDWVKG